MYLCTFGVFLPTSHISKAQKTWRETVVLVGQKCSSLWSGGLHTQPPEWCPCDRHMAAWIWVARLNAYLWRGTSCLTMGLFGTVLISRDLSLISAGRLPLHGLSVPGPSQGNREQSFVRYHAWRTTWGYSGAREEKWWAGREKGNTVGMWQKNMSLSMCCHRPLSIFKPLACFGEAT